MAKAMVKAMIKAEVIGIEAANPSNYGFEVFPFLTIWGPEDKGN